MGGSRDWEGRAEAHAEVGWLRDLALHVAVYLERLGNRDPKVRRVVRPIAQRIRKRLEEGMPAGWRPPGTASAALRRNSPGQPGSA